MGLIILNNCIYFDIVVQALDQILTKLGVDHSVSTTVKPETEKDTYIIFTTHHMHEPLPKHYISYNFEQLITNKTWDPMFFKRLEDAKMVWDYSIENIKVIKKYVNTKKTMIAHVPFGYHESMELLQTPSPVLTRPIKWMMMGALNPNRSHKLQELSAMYPEGYLTNNCWGLEAQKQLYQHSLIGLNLHFYEGPTILEVHRIIPLVANGVYVISERSSDAYYDDLYKQIVTFIEPCPNKLANTVSVIMNKVPPTSLEQIIADRKERLKTQCLYEPHIVKLVQQGLLN
jgi:hypothetical protein